MKKSELRQRLIKENIPTDIYSLQGGLSNEVYCMGDCGGTWEVYYSERGQKTGLKVFLSEKEACNYFYEWLIKSLKNMEII